MATALRSPKCSVASALAARWPSPSRASQPTDAAGRRAAHGAVVVGVVISMVNGMVLEW